MTRAVPPPVFLVGAARSGTSLLYKGMCLHRDAAWISNWLRRYPGLMPLAALNRAARARPAAQQAVWFGGGDNAYVYGSRRTLAHRLFPMPVEGEPAFERCGLPQWRPGGQLRSREAEALRALAAGLTRWSGGKVFVSKRIDHNWRIPLLRAAFPTARFVEIVRDGRAVAYSLAHVDWWEDSEPPWLGTTPRVCADLGMDPWELRARNWVAEVRAIGAGLDAVEPEQRLRIGYEDFILAPATTFERVREFAGLGDDRSWTSRLARLEFPNRNERWRSRLDADAIGRIEGIQADELVLQGYATVA